MTQRITILTTKKILSQWLYSSVSNVSFFTYRLKWHKLLLLLKGKKRSSWFLLDTYKNLSLSYISNCIFPAIERQPDIYKFVGSPG